MQSTRESKVCVASSSRDSDCCCSHSAYHSGHKALSCPLERLQTLRRSPHFWKRRLNVKNGSSPHGVDELRCVYTDTILGHVAVVDQACRNRLNTGTKIAGNASQGRKHPSCAHNTACVRSLTHPRLVAQASYTKQQLRVVTEALVRAEVRWSLRVPTFSASPVLPLTQRSDVRDGSRTRIGHQNDAPGAVNGWHVPGHDCMWAASSIVLDTPAVVLVSRNHARPARARG